MIQAAQLILALSILVVLHELGHFVPAKLFKIRVTKFYLFFNPYFSLFKFKKGETTYGIGWLPLGGYVKIAGMIDESMDKEQMALPPQPWEFRSKPAWQRLIVMLGGVIVNLILGLALFSMIFFVWGKEYLPLENLKQGIYADPVLREVGFENGDKIIALDGEKITTDMALQDVSWAILMKEATKITVDRDGKEEIVSIPDDIDARVMVNKTPRLFETPFPFVIDSVLPDGNAVKAGFMKGDSVTAINGTITRSFYHAQEFLKGNKGKYIDATVYRDGKEMVLKTLISEEGMIGVGPKGNWGEIYETNRREFGVFESISEGSAFAADMFVKNASQLKLLFNENGTKHVGSILSMRKQFSPVWNWQLFWILTANLSLLLAFFNVLPIPALDGGHAIMLIAEIVTGKKPSQKFLEVTQSIGMILLLTLMIFAFGNDIYNGNY